MKKIVLVFAVFCIQLGFAQKVTSLKIENTGQKEKLIELSKNQITSYNNNFLKFLAGLKSSDRKVTDALLSAKAKEIVTDKVYKKLSEDIHFNKTLEIFKSGYKPMIDGSSYPMIQYKYSDDKSQVPTELVTVVFEESGKILGVKPFKK
ncbi:peptidylprolyl isomerase [Chryseobacterium sp. Y16C]|uniref:peptidylprolyl isomerase n=1 Tax=Chryseobacterium sp. Y16C TaxID=2920939 RepID=UPI001F0A4DAA|nr:peptidylprolyl isomerase [Chryseobacterium sp. Y16C]UMQ42494.1 peptidylprolyl isomerase [Chryseobacterium sp. Y16C]